MTKANTENIRKNIVPACIDKFNNFTTPTPNMIIQ